MEITLETLNDRLDIVIERLRELLKQRDFKEIRRIIEQLNTVSDNARNVNLEYNPEYIHSLENAYNQVLQVISTTENPNFPKEALYDATALSDYDSMMSDFNQRYQEFFKTKQVMEQIVNVHMSRDEYIRRIEQNIADASSVVSFYSGQKEIYQNVLNSVLGNNYGRLTEISNLDIDKISTEDIVRMLKEIVDSKEKVVQFENKKAVATSNESKKLAQDIIDSEQNKITHNKSEVSRLVIELEKRGYNVTSLKNVDELIRIANDDIINGTNDLNVRFAPINSEIQTRFTTIYTEILSALRTVQVNDVSFVELQGIDLLSIDPNMENGRKEIDNIYKKILDKHQFLCREHSSFSEEISIYKKEKERTEKEKKASEKDTSNIENYINNMNPETLRKAEEEIARLNADSDAKFDGNKEMARQYREKLSKLLANIESIPIGTTDKKYQRVRDYPELEEDLKFLRLEEFPKRLERSSRFMAGDLSADYPECSQLIQAQAMPDGPEKTRILESLKTALTQKASQDVYYVRTYNEAYDAHLSMQKSLKTVGGLGEKAAYMSFDRSRGLGNVVVPVYNVFTGIRNYTIRPFNQYIVGPVAAGIHKAIYKDEVSSPYEGRRALQRHGERVRFFNEEDGLNANSGIFTTIVTNAKNNVKAVFSTQRANEAIKEKQHEKNRRQVMETYATYAMMSDRRDQVLADRNQQIVENAYQEMAKRSPVHNDQIADLDMADADYGIRQVSKAVAHAVRGRNFEGRYSRTFEGRDPRFVSTDHNVQTVTDGITGETRWGGQIGVADQNDPIYYQKRAVTDKKFVKFTATVLESGAIKGAKTLASKLLGPKITKWLESRNTTEEQQVVKGSQPIYGPEQQRLVEESKPIYGQAEYKQVSGGEPIYKETVQVNPDSVIQTQEGLIQNLQKGVASNGDFYITVDGGEVNAGKLFDLSKTNYIPSYSLDVNGRMFTFNDSANRFLGNRTVDFYSQFANPDGTLNVSKVYAECYRQLTGQTVSGDEIIRKIVEDPNVTAYFEVSSNGAGKITNGGHINFLNGQHIETIAQKTNEVIGQTEPVYDWVKPVIGYTDPVYETVKPITGYTDPIYGTVEVIDSVAVEKTKQLIKNIGNGFEAAAIGTTLAENLRKTPNQQDLGHNNIFAARDERVARRNNQNRGGEGR